MQTVLIIVLVLLIVALLVSLYHDMKDLVLYALFVIVIISMGVGFDLNDTYTTKKPLTPSLEIKCNNGTCDTSYVYKINR